MKILAINPGSTSTKIGVYENETLILTRNIHHSVEELAGFSKATDQFEFRKDLVITELKKANIPFEFDAIIGRGGLLKPIPGGVYEVNEAMRHDILNAKRSHACNLGCLIASELASMLPNCRAFIADPVVVDEMGEIQHLTGTPLLPRVSTWHPLNQKAIARRFAKEHGKRYEDLNLIVCHLGGGISIAAHDHGMAVDVNNALDGEGPFSPERAGTLPASALVDLCFSGSMTKEDIKKIICGKGGVAAHLGTTNMIKVEDMMEAGDHKAKVVLDAMVYNIAKSAAAMSVPLYGKVDAILITGGIAHSDYVVEGIKKYVGFIAPVFVYPGEDELEALELNALGAMRNELEIKEYK